VSSFLAKHYIELEILSRCALTYIGLYIQMHINIQTYSVLAYGPTYYKYIKGQLEPTLSDIQARETEERG